MDWIGGGVEAATEGHDVVMSPASPKDFSYFDHYQSKDAVNEPKAIGGYLPLKQVYQFEPIPATLAPAFGPRVATSCSRRAGKSLDRINRQYRLPRLHELSPRLRDGQSDLVAERVARLGGLQRLGARGVHDCFQAHAFT